MNKVFTYIADDSLKYEVTFTQGYPQSRNCFGKSWAKRTECVIKCNGFIKGVHAVTKHENDKDSTLYAFMNAFKPISKNLLKEARVTIVNQIITYATHIDKFNNKKNSFL